MTSTTNYDLLNQDEAKNEGVEWANEHLDMVKDALDQDKAKKDLVCGECKNNVESLTAPYFFRCLSCDEKVKKVSDLTIAEFKNLMVDCFEMLKQRELDTSMKEYERVCRGDVPLKDE